MVGMEEVGQPAQSPDLTPITPLGRQQSTSVPELTDALVAERTNSHGHSPEYGMRRFGRTAYTENIIRLLDTNSQNSESRFKLR